MTISLAAGLLLAAGCAAAAPDVSPLEALHRSVGKSMDERYYAAGRRVDLVLFDLADKARQGKPAPRPLVRQVRGLDTEMRARWMALDARRKALARAAAQLPPAGRYVLRVDNLENGLSNDGWFGLRSARLTWADGTSVDIAPNSFANGAYQEGYKYLVEPANAVFVYNRLTAQCLMQAGFDMERLPAGNARLTISGVDGDTPGATHIRISLNGATVFEGPNTCRADAWTDMAMTVPQTAFTRPTAAQSAAALEARWHQLQQDVAAFGRWADARAAAIEKVSAAARKGAKPSPLRLPMDWWKTHFVRGVCYVPFAQEYEHHFRSFRDMGANMLYSYTGHYNPPSEFPATMAAVRKVGLPCFQFTSQLSNGSVEGLHWGDPDALVRQSLAFLKTSEGSSGVHLNLSVDEPNFRDNLATNPAVVKAFRQYLEAWRPVLDSAGIEVPKDAVPIVKLSRPQDRPLWMEWQTFKGQFMGSHFNKVWNGLRKAGRTPFVIIQDQQGTFPQQSSYVTMGASLPLISTDLYSNGTVREGFSMQLLRNAARGRTVLTAGAGYSDRTPDRFRRSMAVGMTHADGVLQWTDVYFTKFRDPKMFWKSSTDDQGRDLQAGWNPQYWSIAREMYGQMARADRYLSGGETEATVAVLFSERTAISDSATNAGPYLDNVLGVYSDLVRWGQPLEARFVDNLSAAALRRLRVIVLPDARVLTGGEMERLRQWVALGGTLIVSGQTSLCDQWGRERDDFGLADLFGAHYAGMSVASGSFAVGGLSATIPMNSQYIRVRPDAATRVLAAWASGDPAVLERRAGKGRVLFFTLKNLGARAQGVNGANGLLGKGPKGLPELLTQVVYAAAPPPVLRVEGAPEGVEVQMRRKGSATVVHLVDWCDGRRVSGLALRINRPGRWRVSYPTGGGAARVVAGGTLVPLRDMHIYDMVVVEPAVGR